MNARTLRRGAAVLAGASLLVAGPAEAKQKHRHKAAKAVTVKMELKGAGEEAVPFFSKVPKKIHRGGKLTVENKTDVQAIGPHTFSLVEKSALPKTEDEARACGEEFAGICGTIGQAHEFDPATGMVAKPEVEAGKTGWDTPFGTTGDSWYTETKGESYARKVTAKAGTTLTFFCAVHPNMVGKIKVVK